MSKNWKIHVYLRANRFSSLMGNTVSESDYAHAINVWQRFSIRTLDEYSDTYLKTDCWPIFLRIFATVASVRFRVLLYTTGFTWDVMLKHTRVNFKLLTLTWFYSSNVSEFKQIRTGQQVQSYESSKRIYNVPNNLYNVSTIIIRWFLLGRCRQFWRYESQQIHRRVTFSR